jgi:hypothetical protein
VNTGHAILMYLPYLAFIGFGLNFLLAASVRSWRGNEREHWTLYNFVISLPTVFDSFLGQVGFIRPGLIKHKPTSDSNLDEKSAIRIYYVFAATFLFLGVLGLVLILSRSIG